MSNPVPIRSLPPGVDDLVSVLLPRYTEAPPLPDGWSWRIYEGVLVIEEAGEPVGWVALSDRVPFTAQLAHRIVNDLAKDAP